ncbi:hypothetical protein AC579_10169 [Pseudocercospora musae]|uniref:Uncharacterized protein n=1 Tax=Pseudocercospora musae TaxID=113226 RepID=A0A139I0A6_9PEZI|nr:hypothetical protein AC579_10169 [Pseudocercospora musae]
MARPSDYDDYESDESIRDDGRRRRRTRYPSPSQASYFSRPRYSRRHSYPPETPREHKGSSKTGTFVKLGLGIAFVHVVATAVSEWMKKKEEENERRYHRDKRRAFEKAKAKRRRDDDLEEKRRQREEESDSSDVEREVIIREGRRIAYVPMDADPSRDEPELRRCLPAPEDHHDHDDWHERDGREDRAPSRAQSVGGRRLLSNAADARSANAKIILQPTREIRPLPWLLMYLPDRMPARRCQTHGNRLHRSSSITHTDSALSISSAMTDRILESVAGTPRPTPVVAEETEQTLSTRGSTPCPGGAPANANASGVFEHPQISEHDEDGISATPWSELNRRENDRNLQTAINHVPGSDVNHLRTSIARLQERLGVSTAMIHNLQTRNAIHQADADRGEAQLKQANEARDNALARLADKAKSSNQAKDSLTGLICLILAVIFLYAYACHYYGPEMSYIRQRRNEVVILLCNSLPTLITMERHISHGQPDLGLDFLLSYHTYKSINKILSLPAAETRRLLSSIYRNPNLNGSNNMPKNTPKNINSWERLERGECSLCRLRSLPHDPNRPCACNRLPGETESDFYIRIGTPLPTRASRVDDTPARRRRDRGEPESDGSDPFVASSPLQRRGTVPFSIPALSPASHQTSRIPTLTPPNDPDDIIVLQCSRNTPEPAGPWPSPVSTQIVPETPLPRPSSSNTLGRTPQPTDATTQTSDEHEAHINTLDLHQLRRSRRQAVTELEDSTAQVNLLLLQGQLLGAIKLANQALIKQAECDLVEARLKLVEAERKANTSIWMTTVALWIFVLVVLVVLAILIGQLYDSPDSIYAREIQKQFWEGTDW